MSDSKDSPSEEKKPASGATKKKARPKRKKKPPPKGWTAYTEKGSVPAWVTAARTVMVLAFCATVPTIIGVEAGRRLFWAACIAILPFFWVVGGFHLWRRICPLAVVSLIPKYLGFAGTRNFKKSWLAEKYILLQFGLMIVALTLRLTATNGTIYALIAFLAFVIVAAIVINSLYTGKSWCNYICPVGLVEKFYTEPSQVATPGGGWSQPNSQCSPCTGCKKNCPDIDLEQGYWKEMHEDPRRIAYFAWPGLVFSFYFYYFLVAGNWDYYFSGIWTRENDQVGRLLEPGFYFLESIPVIVAAPLTLIVFCALSFAVFSFGEGIALSRALAKLADVGDDEQKEARREETVQRVRHRSLVLAGFIGFILFYFFGGQPTIRMLPGWFGEIFGALVVVAATAIFSRRWMRSEQDFVKERFAEKLLRRWSWGDKPATGRWQDIVIVHGEREKQEAAYKETIREMVADGVVTSSEMSVLEGMRRHLGVTEKKHKRVIEELSEEEKQLFDPDYQGSVELRLQHNHYHNALKNALLAASRAGRLLSKGELEDLRRLHGADPEEETALLEEFLGADGPVADLVERDAEELHKLANAHAVAQLASRDDDGGDRYGFLAYICRWRATQRLEHALTLVVPLVDGEMHQKLREAGGRLAVGMKNSTGAWAEIREAIGDSPPEVMRSHLEAIDRFAGESAQKDSEFSLEPLLGLLDGSSGYVRAAALYAIARREEDTVLTALQSATADEIPLVRETAYAALAARGGIDGELEKKAAGDEDEAVRLAARRDQDPDTVEQASTTLEKMHLLRSLDLFEELDPDDLDVITGIVRDLAFEDGDDLMREGEIGDDLFIIVEGEVLVWAAGTDGSRAELERCGEGECLGGTSAFERAARTVTVTATRETRALAVEAEAVKSLLASRPAIARTVIDVLMRRLEGAHAAVKQSSVG